MTKNLTENQQKFIAVLFEEANGDVGSAKNLAGYSDTTTTHDVIKCLRDEIAEATRDYMSRIAPKAAVAMGNALVDPTETLTKLLTAVIKSVLTPTIVEAAETLL